MGSSWHACIRNHDDRRPGRAHAVERLWPREIRRDDLELEGWATDAAPGQRQRARSVRRYFDEVDRHPDVWTPPVPDGDDVTPLFSSHDREHNNSVALRDYRPAAEARRDRRR